MKIWDRMSIKYSRIDYLIPIAYLILTVIFTYPVAFSRDKIAGPGGDAYQFIWGFWWFKEALLSFCSPYYAPYIFHPTGVNLAFSTVTPFNSIFSIPLQSAFGLINAYNILWIFSFIASGYGTYLLVKYLTSDRRAAFISGLIFMFCPYHFAHALGHVNLTSIEWIPFYVLFLIKTVREDKRSNAIYAALFLFLTAICCYYYLIYLLVFTLMYILYYLWVDKYSILKKDFLKRLFIMVITFGLIFSPFAYPLLEEILIVKSNYMYASGFVTYSADLFGFFIPSLFHPIFKELVAPIYENFTGNTAEYTTFIGYTVIFLAFVSILKVKTKEIKFWLLSALIFFILCLGPILHINGVFSVTCNDHIASILLPYVILMKIPIISIARAPSRWDILVMLSLAVLAGYGLNYIFKKFNGKFLKMNKKTVLAVVFSCLILFEFLAIPYPMSSANVPNFYYTMAEDPEDYAILEVPNLDPYHVVPEFMYYQTIHEKKLVGGSVSRTPNYAMKFLDSTPFISQLSHLCILDKTIPILREDILKQNITDMGSSILNFYNIRYVILHRTYMTKEQLDFSNKLLQATLKEKAELYDEDSLIVYEVKKEPLESFLTLDENWHGIESWHNISTRWTSNNATIIIHSIENRHSNLSFRVVAFYKPRSLHVYLNDELTHEQEIPTGFVEIEMALKLKEGENILRYYTPGGGQRPYDIPELNSEDSRCLSLAFQNITST
ncbi:hypothetical protein C5S29_11195 [ANME-1 cluster archaeon GoMg3.2]|nr:hypothetical protein [ANME-1 cluster archaeon GoMg3.2]